MKLRLMGTADELQAMRKMFIAQRDNDNVRFVEVSDLYPNRAPSTLCRVYIEIEYKNAADIGRLIEG